MSDGIFKKEWIKPSDYPDNYIPAGARTFIGVDPASQDGECTVKGFYKDGEYHIQSVEYRGL